LELQTKLVYPRVPQLKWFFNMLYVGQL